MRVAIVSIFLVAVLRIATGAEQLIYALVGGVVTLKAPQVSCDYKYWLLNNDQVAWINHLGGRGLYENWKPQVSLSGDSLVIKDIEEKNFGVYKFSCDNKGQNPKITYKLQKISVKVEVKPTQILLSGDEMSLQCDVNVPGTQTKPTIYWLTPTGERKGVQQTNQMKANRQDGGEWTCVVEEHRFKISVTVVDFASAPPVLYTSTTSKLNIKFSILSNNSWDKIIPLIKEIQWFFTSKTPPNQNPQKLFSFSPDSGISTVSQQKFTLTNNLENFSLSKERGEESDEGEYKCTITFKTGKVLTSSVKLVVLHMTPFQKVTLTSGQKFELVCSAHDLQTDDELRWSGPRIIFSQITTKSNFSRLTIQNVRKEDGGKWQCELWKNNVCLTSTTTKLTVEPVLSVWMLVTLCSAAAIITLLIILTAILCRRRQRHRRHFRHRLCRCDNPKPKGFYRT